MRKILPVLALLLAPLAARASDAAYNATVLGDGATFYYPLASGPLNQGSFGSQGGAADGVCNGGGSCTYGTSITAHVTGYTPVSGAAFSWPTTVTIAAVDQPTAPSNTIPSGFGSGTQEYWFKATGSGDQGLVLWGAGHSIYGQMGTVCTGQEAGLGIFPSPYLCTSGSLDDNVAHLIDIACPVSGSGTVCAVYVDKTSIGTISNDSGASYGPAGSYTLGMYVDFAARVLGGPIGSYAFYPTQLTSTQIGHHYDCGFSGTNCAVTTAGHMVIEE